jgi:dienelactone hydrolase
MRFARTGLAVAVSLTALLVGACGADQPSPSGSSARPTPLPIATPTSIADRCKVPFEGGELVEIEAQDGSVVTAATVGTGSTVAVYLHQTTPAGFCGWVSYAAWAAERGVRGLLVDLCGWGRAKCTAALTNDPAAQLRLAVDWARSHGADRVVAVGASLGGATALGVGNEAGVDAIVDLSGPASYPGLPTPAEAARLTTVPLLVAMASNDVEMEPAVVRKAFDAAPAQPKKWVTLPDGHGWGMLNDGTDADPKWTPLAVTVLNWVKGAY